jgi:hypothetical protein
MYSQVGAVAWTAGRLKTWLRASERISTAEGVPPSVVVWGVVGVEPQFDGMYGITLQFAHPRFR